MILRRVVSAVLLFLGTLTLLAAVLDLFAWTAVFDPVGLGRQVQLARRDPAIQRALADALVKRVIEHASPDLIAARPLVQQVVASSIGAPLFDPIFREAAFELHRVLFAPNRAIVFNLADSGVVIAGAIRAYAPHVANQIPPELQDGALLLTSRRYAPPFITSADRVRLLAIVLPLVTVICFVLAIAAAPNRRRAAAGVGVSCYVVASLLAVGLIVGRHVLVGNLSDQGDSIAAAAGAAWDIVLGPLWHWIATLAVAGTILIVAGARINVSAMVRRVVRRLAARPATGWGTALRAAAVLVLGVAMIVDPLDVIRLDLVAIGLIGVAWSIGEILQFFDRDEPGVATAHERSVKRRSLSDRVRTIAGAVVVLGLLGAAESQLRSDGPSPARASDIEACNGYAQLCDRRLTDVAFAATHNSMAAASEPGWYFAAQEGGLPAQLHFGIHGFLIDTHYGVPRARGKRVLTDLRYNGTRRARLVQEIGEPAVALAERLAGGRLGYNGPVDARRPYLCHFLCELGATPLVPALTDIRKWLGLHPHEVIVLIVEDAISPDDTAKAFVDSGLLPLVYTHPNGGPWPTLRQMIATDQRVLVMAENKNGNGRYPWYNAAFSITQDTSYSVRSRDAFNCALNRGKPGVPFFLLNHWIATQPPAPTDAKQVNARSFLLARAEKCERVRAHLPNFVAVDFYAHGDVLGVVDALNRVPVIPSS